MNDGSVRILLEGNRRVYQPGDVLSGEYQVDSLRWIEPAAVEVSVLWHTEGQGEEDLAVHYFERIDTLDQAGTDFRRPHRFSTSLPHSPLTYQGVIVKIHWCVRVRVFLPRGKELVGEAPFQLGTLPPARLATPSGALRRSDEELPTETDLGGGF
ncbi:MAG TPA: hypothetical protein VFI31_13640 [Pirellulales bacterium]|nr:hypothetical protein [Pirellulales bacterium]